MIITKPTWNAPVCAIALAVAITAPYPAQVLAGGDGYEGTIDIDGAGPVIFGFVRDERGATLADAEVMLRPKKGQPISLKSNLMGLYRGHIGKGVSPDDIQVSCGKAGYKEVKVFRRSPPGAQGMIQTECVLQRL